MWQKAAIKDGTYISHGLVIDMFDGMGNTLYLVQSFVQKVENIKHTTVCATRRYTQFKYHAQIS